MSEETARLESSKIDFYYFFAQSKSFLPKWSFFLHNTIYNTIVKNNTFKKVYESIVCIVFFTEKPFIGYSLYFSLFFSLNLILYNNFI